MKAIRIGLGIIVFCLAIYVAAQSVEAVNISRYSDTLSDSGPSQQSNHTFRFIPKVTIGPGSYLDFQFPTGFEVSNATTSFLERNVQLFVNGSGRNTAATSSAGVDGVTITRGDGGGIRYELGSDLTIPAESTVEVRVGNHTTNAFLGSVTFSTSTGTTTTPGDVEPIRNSSALGKHDIPMEILSGGVIANTKFVVFINEKVRVDPVDTTEEIPPFRFNPAPTSTVGGTTLFVEISLETDEFAICRFSTVAGVAFGTMPNTFSNTGLVVHSTIVAVTPGTLQQFFVRCIDDEGNFNIDDFLISFTAHLSFSSSF